MSLLLALALGACDPSSLTSLPEPKRDLGCELVSHQPHGAVVDRGALGEIYARPELSRARQRDAIGLEVFLARLNAWLERFFNTRGMESYSVVTRWLVLVLGALIALGAVARFLNRTRRLRVQPLPPVVSALQLEDPSVHFSRAQAALKEKPRESLRESLLGLLSSLERARLARPDRVKTNRELVRELPSRGAAPELTQSVAKALDWYDETFYSLRPVEAGDAERFLAEVQALRIGAA
ncbi:MAG: DUF4129 domain-containing protein [Myxococcaceae bacterium]